jgi:hypothetical protein
MREFLDLVSRELWRLAVERPAWLLTPEGRRTLLSWATARRVLLVVVTLAAALALVQSLPADLAIFYAGDVATYVDLVAVAWILGAAGRLRGLAEALRAMAAPVLRRRPPLRRPPQTGQPRAVRRRPLRRTACSDNDNEGPRRLAA